MMEFLLAIVIGVVLLVVMLALGKLVGKRAGSSARGQWAAARGWVYEGFDQWTANVPGAYRWSARATLEDSESNVPQLEFQAGLDRPTALTLLIEPRAEAVRNAGALTPLDPHGSGDFAQHLIVYASDAARARAIMNESWMALWNNWPQRAAQRMYLHANAQSITLRIPEQSLARDSDVSHFLQLGDEMAKQLARSG